MFQLGAQTSCLLPGAQFTSALVAARVEADRMSALPALGEPAVYKYSVLTRLVVCDKKIFFKKQEVAIFFHSARTET